MANKYLEDRGSDGNVMISDEVVGRIAAVSANTVDGVVEHTKDIRAGVADMFGVKTSSKFAKVSIGETEAIIDLYVTVRYGKDIVAICNEVQEKVKESVEMMTGLDVVEVNVHVVGIAIDEPSKVRE